MNNFNDIEALLDKYWEGESSVEEERRLKAYFNSGEVAERFQKYAPLFKAIREEQAVQLQNGQKPQRVIPVMFHWQPWAAAASIALVIFAGWWMLSKPDAPTVATNDVHPDYQIDTSHKHQEAKELPVVKSQSEEVVLADTPKVRKPGLFRKKRVVQPNQEEETAMQEIKAALALISSKIGKGRNEAAKGAVHLETMDRIFKHRDDG